MLNVASTQFTLQTSSFEIYLSGCSSHPKCDGCHNPELWDFNNGRRYFNVLNDIILKITEFDDLIENIWILGGEPLDNNLRQLEEMLKILNDTFNKNIWLFTRYDLCEVPKYITQYLNYIKCGKYIPELKTENNIQHGIKLSTSNQKIYKLKNIYRFK